MNDTSGENMLAFDVAANGATSNRRNFAKYPNVTKGADGTPNSGADGLAVDSAGRLYCAALGGVQVFVRRASTLAPSRCHCSRRTLPSPVPQEDPLHRGSRFGVQGPGSDRRLRGAREVRVMGARVQGCTGAGGTSAPLHPSFELSIS